MYIDFNSQKIASKILHNKILKDCLIRLLIHV